MPMVAVDTFISKLSITWFGSSKETWMAYAVLILGIVCIPIILVVENGQFLFVSVFMLIVGILFLTFHRLDWGLNILVGFFLLADSYGIPGFRPFTYTLFYHRTLNEGLKIFAGMNPGWGILTPFEMHTILLYSLWLILVVAKKQFDVVANPNRKTSAIFVALLVFSFLYGKMKGGDPIMALWELRALPFLLIISWIVPQIIKAKEQLYSLMWVVIGVIGFKAFQAFERFQQTGFVFGDFRTFANHEDAVFIVTMFIFLVALYVYGCKVPQRRWLSSMTIVLLMGFYLANRRATYASFAISLIAVFILLDKERQRRSLKYAGIFLIFFSVYLAAYWNSYGRLAVIAQGVKSTLFSQDKSVISYEDFSSALARDQENYDMSVTFQHSPLLGIGFGRAYEMPITFYGDYTLKGYIAHNEILWILIKSGAMGYFIFFLFLNSILFYGTRVFRGLRDPYLKAVCVVCVVAVINQVVVSHVDMQLTYSRNMGYLGLLIGLLPAIERIDRNNSSGTGRVREPLAAEL